MVTDDMAHWPKAKCVAAIASAADIMSSELVGATFVASGCRLSLNCEVVVLESSVLADSAHGW